MGRRKSSPILWSDVLQNDEDWEMFLAIPLDNRYWDYVAYVNGISNVYFAAMEGRTPFFVEYVRWLEQMDIKVPKRLLANPAIRKALNEEKEKSPPPKSEQPGLWRASKYSRHLVKARRMEIRHIPDIPRMAMQQAIVALTAAFEGYIKDFLEEVFRFRPECMKSIGTTLSDEELVDSLGTGNTLQVLEEQKVRNLMSKTPKEWFKFMDKRLGITINKGLESIDQLFLIRNCIVHNNGRASKELHRAYPLKRYTPGKRLSVTEQEFKRFANATIDVSAEMWRNYENRIQKKNRSVKDRKDA